ncbi:hypothetical protein BCR36DRAFT_222741, partial [Piromyces finnis]
MDNKNFMNTKEELTGANYKIWAEDMKMILKTHKLYQYISSEKLKKIKKSDIKEVDLKNHIQVEENPLMYYSSDVTEDMISEDTRTRLFLSHNINKEVHNKVDFSKNTAFEIWKLLKNTYNKGDHERKAFLLKELNEIKFRSNDDISMHISNMENIFNELESLGEPKSNDENFNFLYKSLPTDVIIFSSIIIYQNNWDKCKKHMESTVPRL